MYSADDLELLSRLVGYMAAKRREENAGNTFEAEDDDPTWTPNLEKCFIHKLSFGILAVIFNLVVDVYRNAPRRLDTVRTRAPLNIARVCKSWREVALDTPSLWTQIGPSSAPFINTFLARSGSELLDIYWEPTKLPGPTDASGRTDLAISFLQPLRDHVHRLHTLDIWATPLSVYQQYLTSPAPNLEGIYASNGMGSVHIEPLDAPDVLFQGHTPRLRELVLGRICISLDSPIFANLIGLRIEDVAYTRSKLSHLVQVLNACPALEQFQLTNVHFQSASPTPATQANLSCLKSLSLHEICLNAVRYILASVIIPPTACLSLRLDNATVGTTFPPNADYATRLPNVTRIRSLCTVSLYDHFEHENIKIVGYESPMYEDGTQLLTLEFMRMEPFAVHTVLLTLEWLPMPLLENVGLIGFAHAAFTAERLSRFFANFDTITTLSLTADIARFADILIVTPESHLCPSLESLRLWGSSIDAETVVELVRSRQTSRHPLAKLEFGRCEFITQADVEELEGLGITVEWKERET
ncbi:hypothetical protein BOTBODRAFT_190312 [Botryobasidium botryosum FD-172 SS1]|uniref:F-box domain-containing protein n=1 Tax=Botryobasidium botryosum (strain FD-172 SS1) TaxID=930990 RepID=A0A067M504_BOTB1|nr:hypothetical protein BOTBODRAFT_190312 [Botryobasidium botryosum FD-172 SS1]